MKGEKQKISKDTCLQRDRAEPERYAGGQTFMWITENNITNADQPNIWVVGANPVASQSEPSL